LLGYWRPRPRPVVSVCADSAFNAVNVCVFFFLPSARNLRLFGSRRQPRRGDRQRALVTLCRRRWPFIFSLYLPDRIRPFVWTLFSSCSSFSLRLSTFFFCLIFSIGHDSKSMRDHAAFNLCLLPEALGIFFPFSRQAYGFHPTFRYSHGHMHLVPPSDTGRLFFFSFYITTPTTFPSRRHFRPAAQSRCP